MKQFAVYTAECTGNAKNCHYPVEVVVRDITSLRLAMDRDHVCAKYRDNRRSAAGFEWSDCIPMDCDNDHSEDPAQWKQPEDVVATFPGVAFAVCFSRNHRKEKNGRAARPKFHCYFPIERISDGNTYAAMKKRIQELFPFFDRNAVDSARFCYGTQDPQVMFFDGDHRVDKQFILAGGRNATLSQRAARIVKRYGDSLEAEQLFQKEAQHCVPPLEQQELQAINRRQTAPCGAIWR